MSAYQHTGTCSVGEPCPRCYEFGGRMEQERIIKLLVDELYINPSSNYGQQLIALIKGEK